MPCCPCCFCSALVNQGDVGTEVVDGGGGALSVGGSGGTPTGGRAGIPIAPPYGLGG
jgi:hypothetical protein